MEYTASGNRKTRDYSPYLNRWLQPDSIIPDANNPLDYDRYAYTRNNPLKYTDPSGHIACEVLGTEDCDENGDYIDTPPTEADEIWKTFEGGCGSDCANFVSTVLHEYGLDLRYEYPYWRPDCRNVPWANAAGLFDFLTNVLGFEAIELPYETYTDIILPEGTPVFYNDGSYQDGNAGLYPEPFRFNHAAVVVGQQRDLAGHDIPVVLDVDGSRKGRHHYNNTSTVGQAIWVILIGVYP